METTAVLVSRIESVAKIADPERFGSLTRMIRVTAWILIFVNRLSAKVRGRQIKPTSGPLDATELSHSLEYWIKITQQDAFQTELKSLKNNQRVETTSRLANFQPKLDKEGILRYRVRTQLSKDMDEAEREPIILPHNGPVVDLLIRDTHRRLLHAGAREVFAELRIKYWILRGGQAIKRVLFRCVTSERHQGGRFGTAAGPLPVDHCNTSDPFEVTGVDFAGPLYVRGRKGKEMRKAYICLFTCAATHAVHLELTETLTPESFWMALRRLISRRGLCRVIYSDNARTFKRANMDLKRLWTGAGKTKIAEYFATGVTWKFIVERVPSWGGFWERMVRTMKAHFRKILGKASLCFEELKTILSEIEAVVNSRPITYIYNDSHYVEPLTSSHLLVGKRLTTLPPFHPKKEDSLNDHAQLTKRARYRDRLINSFSIRWRRDYLQELGRPLQKPSKFRVPVAGDIVLVHEDNIPRHMWKIGLVLETFKGRDGEVRSARLTTSDGELKRPIQRLYPLEVQQAGAAEQSTDEHLGKGVDEMNPEAVEERRCEQSSSRGEDVEAQVLRRSNRLSQMRRNHLGCPVSKGIGP